MMRRVRSYARTAQGPLLVITDDDEGDVLRAKGRRCFHCGVPLAVSQGDGPPGFILLEGELCCWACFEKEQLSDGEPDPAA